MSRPLALIVEDEYDIAMIFARALQAAGLKTDIVRAGDTALAWLSINTPDIIVLDLGLPNVSGEDVLKHVRADRRLANVKVIIATAYSILGENIHDNADWILTKPIGFSQLRDLAARVVSTILSSERQGQVPTTGGQ